MTLDLMAWTFSLAPAATKSIVGKLKWNSPPNKHSCRRPKSSYLLIPNPRRVLVSLGLDLTRSIAEDAVRSFLAEDIGYVYITTNALIDPKQKAEGRAVCKENAAVSGIKEALVLLDLA